MIEAIHTTCGRTEPHDRHDWDGPLGEWYECPGVSQP